MMLNALSLLLILAVAACSADHSAPLASGPWRPLNAAQWDVDPNLVTAPTMPEVKS